MRIVFVLVYCFTVKQCMATLNLGSWKKIEDLSFKLSGRSIEFPCNSTKDIYKESGKYVPQNMLITRTQIYKYEAVVTIPRHKTGVPITLGVAQLKDKGREAKIKPFPDWPLQQEGNCNAIQSAVDVYLDRKDVLWVLDDGIIDTFGTPYRKCNPKVLAISMKTGNVIRTIDLSSFINENSTLKYIVAESPGDDEDYVYVSDAEGGAIITFNAKSGKGRRLVLPPVITKRCRNRDTLYLTITMRADHEGYLYFTYSGSDYVYTVQTVTIRQDQDCGAIKIVGRKPEGSETVFYGTDNLSSLFFGHSNNIYMWDSNTPWNKNQWKLVQRDSPDRQTTQVAPGPWKMFWVLESNVLDYVTNNVGCFGASSYLHPIAKDVYDKSSLSLASKLKI